MATRLAHGGGLGGGGVAGRARRAVVARGGPVVAPGVAWRVPLEHGAQHPTAPWVMARVPGGHGAPPCCKTTALVCRRAGARRSPAVRRAARARRPGHSMFVRCHVCEPLGFDRFN